MQRAGGFQRCRRRPGVAAEGFSGGQAGAEGSRGALSCVDGEPWPSDLAFGGSQSFALKNVEHKEVNGTLLLEGYL